MEGTENNLVNNRRRGVQGSIGSIVSMESIGLLGS